MVTIYYFVGLSLSNVRYLATSLDAFKLINKGPSSFQFSLQLHEAQAVLSLLKRDLWYLICSVA